MSKARLILTVALAVLLFCGANSNTYSEAPEDDFNSVKREIQKDLRSRKPADRAAAIVRLEQYPRLEAVKMMVPLAFKNQSDEVRKAGFHTLLSFKENAEICNYLLETLTRETGGRGTRETIYPILSVLLASDLPEIETELLAQLDKLAQADAGGMLLLLTLADDLGKQADEDSLAALVKLAKSDLFNREFPYRRSIVQAMTRIREPEAIDALIKLMGEIDGEARGDIVRYLTEITGQDYDTDRQGWAEWWQENKEDFSFPAPIRQVAMRPAQPTQRGSLASYYGLPLYAKRLVFVLDTSKSMTGEPLEQAKEQLIYAINKLPNDTEFSVVVYNSRVGAWNTRLVPAASDAKSSAAKFVMGQQADALTASFNALETAFGFNAEAIYFLSDGEPTAGKIVIPAKIVSTITEGNRLQRKSIYTIGIGVRKNEGPFELFLKSLAEQNFGVYRPVE